MEVIIIITSFSPGEGDKALYFDALSPLLGFHDKIKMAEEIQRFVLPASNAFDVLSLNGSPELDSVITGHVQVYINYLCVGDAFPKAVIDNERASTMSCAKIIGLEKQAQGLLDAADRKYAELKA